MESGIGTKGVSVLPNRNSEDHRVVTDFFRFVNRIIVNFSRSVIALIAVSRFESVL